MIDEAFRSCGPYGHAVSATVPLKERQSARRGVNPAGSIGEGRAVGGGGGGGGAHGVTSTGKPVDILDQMRAILAPRPNFPRVCFMPYLVPVRQGKGTQGLTVIEEGGRSLRGHQRGRGGVKEKTRLRARGRACRGCGHEASRSRCPVEVQREGGGG